MEKELKILLEKAIPRIAIRLQTELVLVAPVDKGRLKSSIRVVPSPDGKGVIVSMVDYGKLVEFGTNPHIIKPNTKDSLRFKPKGEKKFVFAKEVKHPGTRPNPFIRNTLKNKLRGIVLEELEKASL